MENLLSLLIFARGLRQGDQMSPYLFAIAMEYLSRHLNEFKHCKTFKYHPRCSKLGITHLSFADDLLLFAKADVASVTALQHCFKSFSQASGLQANLEKSSVYFGGTTQTVQDEILSLLGYSCGELPFKYLGVPFSTKKLTMSGANVITKKALVAWERVCTPKSAGGLNLINLQLWNKVAIAKTCWDLEHKEDKLWIRWIHAFYIKGQQFYEVIIPQKACWMVRKNLEVRTLIAQVQHNATTGKSLIKVIYL
ncbi:uncharacterized protein LOC132042227 [Lycium ferocissimum]|uniref:uncharacterized protein LOC132042227 n=1 Tax=Lycium ferocissimum TaxID=112874 RepID=UPI002814B6F2|nr:uncharacterized protein LOC132042227 [Lycium ferocissimum]